MQNHANSFDPRLMWCIQKNSGHFTTFEASEKLFLLFASEASFIVRAASAADWAARAAFVINSTSASGAAVAMLEASKPSNEKHDGVGDGAQPVYEPFATEDWVLSS